MSLAASRPTVRPPRTWQLLALVAHVGLALSVGATIAVAALPVPLRVLLAGLAVLPLIVTFPGLKRSSTGVLAWLAVALVIYTGLGTVEVIAAGTRLSIALLLFATTELCLVLVLSRRLRFRASDATTGP
jgi:uncharacterized membrane protein